MRVDDQLVALRVELVYRDVVLQYVAVEDDLAVWRDVVLLHKDALDLADFGVGLDADLEDVTGDCLKSKGL